MPREVGRSGEEPEDVPQGHFYRSPGERFSQVPAPHASECYCIHKLNDDLARVTFFIRREGQSREAVLERAKQEYPDSVVSSVRNTFISAQYAPATHRPMQCCYIRRHPEYFALIIDEQEVMALKEREPPLEDWEILMARDFLSFLKRMQKDLDELRSGASEDTVESLLEECGSSIRDSSVESMLDEVGRAFGFGSSGRNPNDDRSNSLNPNNAAYRASMDNRSNQMNPNNPAYRSSRRGGRRR